MLPAHWDVSPTRSFSINANHGHYFAVSLIAHKIEFLGRFEDIDLISLLPTPFDDSTAGLTDCRGGSAVWRTILHMNYK